MSKLRRRLSVGSGKKKLRRPEKLKSEPKIKVIKRYPKEQCMTEGCTHNAVGKGVICKRCGGDPVIKENLLEVREIPIGTLMNTKYDPDGHPLQFIALSREGLSDVEIAAEFGVSVTTLRGWSERFADFNTAYDIGKDMHEAWWLREGKENLDNRSYNTGLFKFLAGNKLGYSDKMESKNLNITAGVLMVPAQQSQKEWEGEN